MLEFDSQNLQSNNIVFFFAGGFTKFYEICPEYVEEVLKLNVNSKYYDMQLDQHQSSIDQAVMTKIEP